MELLSFRLSEDPRLLTRVIRLLGGHLSHCEAAAAAAAAAQPAPMAVDGAPAGPEGAPASAQVEGILAATIFPALACLPCNPGVSNELWNLMQPLPYPSRFRVYAAFKAFYTGAGVPPEVAAGTAVALSDTKKVLRRLSKENVKEFGRRLAKPTHSQPILVANTLITQARARASHSCFESCCLRRAAVMTSRLACLRPSEREYAGDDSAQCVLVF